MKINNNSPIGIFDSGIGGLTVAKAISRLLPNEQIIYFGDTAHLPYGDKSKDLIVSYATQIADFLLSKGCKVIIIACNTASALAFDEVQKFVNHRAVVFNVIDPVVNYIIKNYENNTKIGVIGTKGTINSHIYLKKINKYNPKLNVVEKATPLLAPMIEEGFFNNKISKTIIHSYLSKKKLKNIKAIVLACTHYPLIKDEIADYYKHKVDILDTAEIVAKYIRKTMSNKKILANNSVKQTEHLFFVSDFTEAFEASTKYFFDTTIHLKEIHL